MSSPDRLVYMANQIGWFFKSQGSAILAHLEKGGAGLDPDVKEAITTLKKAGAQ